MDNPDGFPYDRRTMLQISVLGSGSSGNSAVVFTDRTRLLIDAGLSARQLRLRLETIGMAPESLDAVLITHEHGDHVRGLDVFCRGVRVPLYTNPMTREVLVSGILKEPKTWRLVTTGGKFTIGDIEIQTFPVAHDATEPMGFALRDGESGIGILSDVGYVTNLMRAHVREVNTLFIEANYDEMLLQNDTKRPWSTKQRILSRHGHLSNAQAAGLVGDIAGDHLSRVILGHLSQDCNEASLAMNVVKTHLGERGFPHIDVLCARPDLPTDCFPAQHRAIASYRKILEAKTEIRVQETPSPGVAVAFAGRAEADRSAVAVETFKQCELF